MPTTTVRISTQSHETLKKIAGLQRSTVRAVLEGAIEDLRRQRFLEAVNDSYADLRAAPSTWSEVVREREDWDAALSDGLAEPPGPSATGPGPQRETGRDR